MLSYSHPVLCCVYSVVASVQPLLQEDSTGAHTATPTPRDQAVPGRTTAYDDVADSSSVKMEEDILRKKTVRAFAIHHNACVECTRRSFSAQRVAI